MKTIALVIGHGPKVDRGAVNGSITELDWNTDLAAKIKGSIGSRANVHIIHRVTERQPPIAEVNATGADLTVELHLNAFNGTASGTEMIHAPNSTAGRALAQRLQSAAVSVLGLPDRGIKGPQGGGRGAAFLTKTKMPAVIVESFFIDNDADLARGNTKKVSLASAYAEALLA